MAGAEGFVTDTEVRVVARDAEGDLERTEALCEPTPWAFLFLFRLAFEGAGEVLLRLLDGALDGGRMEKALLCLMMAASSFCV